MNMAIIQEKMGDDFGSQETGVNALSYFKENNIEVILGATGSIEETLEVYLGGELESTGSACSHHHGDDHDHDHGHNCEKK